MGRNNWFEFKQFRIVQQRAAMKVGTDGVLLGAWTLLNDAARVLDIGSGTGLIALMLAQRSEAIIDAVEIDEPASEETLSNFQQSPWSTRLTVYNTGFREYILNKSGLYDLIVSNPPYFVNSLKTQNAALSVARHNDQLSFDELITGAGKLLCVSGRLCVIIPGDSLVEFREIARLADLYLYHQTLVIPKAGKSPKRVLLEFGKNPCYPFYDDLTILDEFGRYTKKFMELTEPFYPAF